MKKALWTVGAIVLLAVAALLVFKDGAPGAVWSEAAGWTQEIARMLEASMASVPAWVFLLALAVLPAAGVPVSLFYVLAGVRFGLLVGLAVSIASIPVHLALVHLAGRRFLLRVNFWLARRISGPEAKPLQYASPLALFLFASLPGLPYVVKNIALAGAGPGLGRELLPVWAGHALIGAPFVCIGAAAQSMEPATLAAGGVLLAVIMFLPHMVQRLAAGALKAK